VREPTAPVLKRSFVVEIEDIGCNADREAITFSDSLTIPLPGLPP
jgi:hypothetical protein